MTVKEFNNILNKKILILDGATGTELQKRGMPKGVCPEKWVAENPDVIIEIQKKYKESGSDIVYSCTFGANRFKLEEFGLENEVYELNKKLAECSRKAMGNDGFVAGDIAPTGKFIEPFGDVAFETAVDVYKEQVKALASGGVDLFVIETMIDIQEMRAAVIAIKEICDLPILASMTFSEDGLTLTGTDPVTALITLQSLGVSAFGCNCSTGPDKMLEIIKRIKPYATVPLMAKPNAGLPKLVNGNTVFDMLPEEFAGFVPDFMNAGINIFGGCCGTSFEYIRQSSIKTKNFKPVPPKISSISAVSSARSTVLCPYDGHFHVIGERINPTGKKKLQAELKEGKFDIVKKYAVEQKSAGASILDVNMGMSGINEKDMMIKTLKLLCTISTLPLCIDSSNPDVIEAALRLYPGRALINSISAEKEKLKNLIPIAAKYGVMSIVLPLNDEMIPETADDRIKLINEIFSIAQEHGFTKEDIVIDGLVMTISSDQKAAEETLKLINWCTYDFKVNTVMGLSNVSFGLPARKLVNTAFLAMAMFNGASMAIANPSEEILMNIKFASETLIGKDKNCKNYINHFASFSSEKPQISKQDKKITDLIYESVLEGDKDKISDLIKKALDKGYETSDIVDNYLIPAINKVGDLYDKKEYFLPQLVSSAEAMKTGFNFIEPFLEQNQSGNKKDKIKIILATVKGDIHDIGKNIVGLMLKNYGFDVIDLGKDVAAEIIIEEAKKQRADVIGLSALMTTTMTEMKTVIDMANSNNLDTKIIIGGAVITQAYADEINAHGYAADSIETVKLVKELTGSPQ